MLCNHRLRDGSYQYFRFTIVSLSPPPPPQIHPTGIQFIAPSSCSSSSPTILPFRLRDQLLAFFLITFGRRFSVLGFICFVDYSASFSLLGYKCGFYVFVFVLYYDLCNYKLRICHITHLFEIYNILRHYFGPWTLFSFGQLFDCMLRTMFSYKTGNICSKDARNFEKKFFPILLIYSRLKFIASEIITA
jgi:hypothetical protein